MKVPRRERIFAVGLCLLVIAVRSYGPPWSATALLGTLPIAAIWWHRSHDEFSRTTMGAIVVFVILAAIVI